MTFLNIFFHRSLGRQTRWPWLVFVVLEIIIGWFALLPFARENTLVQWDMLGHFFSAWSIRHLFWPAPVGWNAWSFLGYPQGTFYPPLFHWLAAALSWVMPLTASLKSLVIAAVAATPISAYWYARSLRLSAGRSVVSVVGIVCIMAIPFAYSAHNNAIGGTLYSTFTIGLLTNAFAVPLWFLYAASLHRSLPSGRWLGPAILASLLVLTHEYVAIAAGVYAIVWLVVAGRSKWKTWMYHGIMAALLTAWWWAPFIGYHAQTSTGHVGFSQGHGGYLVLGLGLAAAGWLLYRQRLKNLSVPATFLLAMTITIPILGFTPWPVQTFRLVFFPLCLTPIFLSAILRGRKLMALVSAVAFVGIVWGMNQAGRPGGYDPRGPQVVVPPLTPPIGTTLPTRWAPSLAEEGKKGGGSLTTAPPESPALPLVSPVDEVTPHLNQFLWPIWTNTRVTSGLFTDSSITARYLLTLEQMIDPRMWSWAGPLIPTQSLPTDIRQHAITDHLRQFGIASILAVAPSSLYDQSRSHPLYTYSAPTTVVSPLLPDQPATKTPGTTLTVTAYTQPPTPLVEALQSPTRSISTDWQNQVDQWFIGDDTSTILVRASQSLPSPVVGAVVRDITTSKRMDKIAFTIQAATPTPVYMKMSYFPKWRATSDGKNINVYQASPNMMVIVANGRVVLTYTAAWWERLAWWISIATAVFFIFFGIASRGKHIDIHSGKS